MVFYLPDTLLHGKWRVVQNFRHGHLWSVTETEVEKGPGDGGLTYQDDDSTEVLVQSRVRRDRNVCSLMLQQLKASRKEERW